MTPEQAAAQEALQVAIQDHCMVWNPSETPEMVIEWATVVYTTEVDQDRDGYYTIYSGGSMADHRALGLFHIGLKILDKPIRKDTGDDND